MTMTAANKDAGTRTRTLKRIPSSIPAIAPVIKKTSIVRSLFRKFAQLRDQALAPFCPINRPTHPVFFQVGHNLGQIRYFVGPGPGSGPLDCKPSVLRLAHALASDALTDLAQPAERALIQTPAKTMPLATRSQPSSFTAPRQGLDGADKIASCWDLHSCSLGTLSKLIRQQYRVTPSLGGGGTGGANPAFFWTNPDN